MKLLFLSLTLMLLQEAQAQASQQQDTEDTSIVAKTILFEFSEWDAIRGLWLAQSVTAMSKNQPIPDRTFAEELTPYEMLSLMPKEKREDLKNYIETNQVERQGTNKLFTTLLLNLLNKTFCRTMQGRSYGDPHLRSFDNATYSFQTVGEFELSKSSDNNFEIQARQKAQGDNFSLNTAIALNMHGDRIGFYADDAPSSNITPLFLDGSPIQLHGRTYFLPRGGTIYLNGSNYVLSWPTGEKVILNRGASGERNFINVTVTIFECSGQQYSGLLGNANKNMNDDFNGRDNNQSPLAYQSFSTFGNPIMQQASIITEKEYLSYLAQSFADNWRITDNTTLFDYPMGTNTAYFTDRRFPRVHLTVADLNANQQSNARRRCEAMGIGADEMGGCIFDQGHLNMGPNPVPTPAPATQGVIFNKLERPLLNTNTHQILDAKSPSGGGQPKEPSEGEIQEKPGKTDIKADDRNNSITNPSNPIQIKVPNTNNKPVISKPNKPINTSPVKPTKNAKPGKG